MYVIDTHGRPWQLYRYAYVAQNYGTLLVCFAPHVILVHLYVVLILQLPELQYRTICTTSLVLSHTRYPCLQIS